MDYREFRTYFSMSVCRKIVPSASLLGHITGALIVRDPWLVDWIGIPDTLVGVVVPSVIAVLLAPAGFATRPAALRVPRPGSLSLLEVPQIVPGDTPQIEFK